jgi:hypothetical protein
MMDLGKKIKEFGEEKFKGNITKYAEATKKSRTDLYRYIKNETSPGGEFFLELYKLGCDMNWLFSEETTVMEPGTEYKVVRVTYYEEYDQLKAENEKLKAALVEIKDLVTAKIKEFDRGQDLIPIQE